MRNWSMEKLGKRRRPLDFASLLAEVTEVPKHVLILSTPTVNPSASPPPKKSRSQNLLPVFLRI